MAFGTDASNRMGSPQAIGATFFNKTIDQSLRFEDGDNPYLRRTMVAGTDNKKFTFSAWIKRCKLTERQAIFSAGDGSTNSVELRFGSSDNLEYLDTNNTYLFITSAAYRDPSAWYHIVMRVDTTQSNEKQRARLYVNGEEVVNFSTDNRSQYTLNEATTMNTAQPLDIGRWVSAQEYFDGYMAEIHYSDGYSYGPEYYGENKNGVWIPKQVTDITYGTNGFHLDFFGADGGFSAYFDGAGDNITWTDASNFDIGTSDDFCVEFFFNGDYTSTYSYAIGDYQNSGFLIQFSSSRNLYFYYGISASIGPFDVSSYVGTTTWHHYAVVRHSGTYYIYVDGVQRGTSSTGGTAAFNNARFQVGDAHPSAGAPHLLGYISNLRFTVGSARYPSGTSFTAPTSTLTSDSTNVKLLAFTNSTITNDASSFNHTGVIDEGAPVFSSYGPFAGGLLSEDKSGNDNHFSMSGLADTDVLPDSPTSNFNVNNPLDPLVSDRGVTLSQGNLRVQGGSGNYNASPTFDKVPGSYYAEFYVEEADNNTQTAVFARFSLLDGTAFNYRYNADNELKKDGTTVATPGAFSDGDIIGVAASTVNNYVEFFKNGVSVYANTHTAAFESVSLTIRLDNTTTPKFICNYGQDASFAGNVTGANGYSVTAGGEFKYQPPRGFRAVKASNLTEPVLNPRNDSIENSFFYTTLYEGNGGGQRVGQFLPLNEVKTVNNAIRFEDGDTPSLTRTSSSASSSDKQFTFSCWFKIGDLSGNYRTLLGTAEGGDREYIGLMDTNDFIYQVNNGTNLISNRKFLDTSSWHHVVVAVNINESTASDRQKIYINGEQITSFSSSNYYGSSDTVNFMKSGVETRVGGLSSSYNNPWDGYLADVHFVDGSTLTPTSFGQTDPSTEKWIPKTYSGTHGTNGFHLEFLNDTVGADSAATNSFTPVNLTTANTVIDTPTKNFAVLDKGFGVIGNPTLSEGNLKADGAGFSSTLWGGGFASIPLPSTGKYYFECQDTAATGSSWGAGVCSEQAVPTSTNVGGPESITFYNRSVYLNGTSNDYGASAGFGGLGDATYAAGDIMGVAVDCSTREVWFSQNGTFIDTPTTDNTGTPGNPSAGTYPVGTVDPNDSEPMRFVLYGSASNMICNFGQDSSFAGQIDPSANTDGSGGQFKFTPPTGFKALNVDNLPQRSQGIARRKTPVFTWIKNRDSTDSHMLFDQVRGATKVIHSDPDTHQVETTEVNTLQKFVPGGFQIGNDVQVNTAGESYVAWNWCMHDDIVNAGPQTMSPAGTIAATGLADRKLGFSIVKFTGTGANGTVGHGLSQAPEMIMAASLETVSNWIVYHKFSDGTDGRQFLNLNKTIASFDNGPNSYFQDTPPSSTVISVNGSTYNTLNNDFVYYCFHSVPGFSKYNVYTGNASADGKFVHCGFKPAFVMMKRLGSGGWHVFDNQRSPTNANDDIRIELDNSDAENNGSSNNLYIDFVSNGFKLRTTFDNMNGSSDYIYWAMAEQPFMFANAR